MRECGEWTEFRWLVKNALERRFKMRFERENAIKSRSVIGWWETLYVEVVCVEIRCLRELVDPTTSSGVVAGVERPDTKTKGQNLNSRVRCQRLGHLLQNAKKHFRSFANSNLQFPSLGQFSLLPFEITIAKRSASKRGACLQILRHKEHLLRHNRHFNLMPSNEPLVLLVGGFGKRQLETVRLPLRKYQLEDQA